MPNSIANTYQISRLPHSRYGPHYEPASAALLAILHSQPLLPELCESRTLVFACAELAEPGI